MLVIKFCLKKKNYYTYINYVNNIISFTNINNFIILHINLFIQNDFIYREHINTNFINSYFMFVIDFVN